jgi:excisionase family DNA binding protein
MTHQKLLKIVPDVTTRYGLSRSSIYKLIDSGVLKPIKIGRSVRIDVDQADAALSAAA